MDQELTLRIILEKPTPGVDFALQKGTGNNYEKIQKQRSAGEDLNFQFDIRVKPDKDGNPDFFGPFVQGPRGGRFVYLDIGKLAGQFDSIWDRRLKIPLTGIDNKILKLLNNDPEKYLETKVPGTGKDGGPNCATVKPFAGWKSNVKM